MAHDRCAVADLPGKDYSESSKVVIRGRLRGVIVVKNKEMVRSLEAFFRKQRGVILAFLFGSSVANRMHPASDVDIGILFKAAPNLHEVNDLASRLSSRIQREIDLVVLNQASPVLGMQILKHGVLIYASDRKHYHQFFVDTVNQYDDLKRIRKNCEDSILKGRIYA